MSTTRPLPPATPRPREAASEALAEALDGTAPIDRVLLKAAAGAGKSYALKRLVTEALDHDRCDRVAVIAFTNKQLHPLAESLGKTLGRDKVCLFVKDTTIPDLPRGAADNATVVSTASAIPPETQGADRHQPQARCDQRAEPAEERDRRRLATAPASTTCSSSTRRGSCRTTCSTR